METLANIPDPQHSHFKQIEPQTLIFHLLIQLQLEKFVLEMQLIKKQASNHFCQKG